MAEGARRPPEDKKVCWFGAAALAARRDAGDLVGWTHPDDVVHDAKAIDLVANYKRLTIVAEHTSVPITPKQVGDVVAATTMFDGFAERFGNALPRPGHYTLEVDPGGAQSVPRRDRDGVLAAIQAWVQTGPVPYREDVSLSPITAEIGLQVRLYRRRCEPSDEGLLSCKVVYFGPRNPSEDALRKAITTKCPKLATEKSRQPRSVSLLVLESHDLRMASPWALYRTTFVASSSVEEQMLPDVIVWVDTLPTELEHWPLYWPKDGDWMASASCSPPPQPIFPINSRMRSFSAPAVRATGAASGC